MKSLVLAIVVIFTSYLFVDNSAYADLFIIQPGQLKYSFQESGRELDAAYCSIKKSGNGYLVVVTDHNNYGGGVDSCNSYVEIYGTLGLNQFVMKLQVEVSQGSYRNLKSGELSATQYQTDVDGAGSIADNFAWNVTPPITINELYDVQVGTVFTKAGSCYSKQLRLEADPQSKSVNNMWIQEVAAKCP